METLRFLTTFTTLALTLTLTVHAAATSGSLSSSGQSNSLDMTLQDGAKGPQVVDAVVDRIKAKCIFADDRLFLRRMAYVVSRDGIDSATYRVNFHGGIWQVNETAFNATMDGTSSYVNFAISRIKSELAIDWSKVTWSDLRKPLYSGLAATLTVIRRLGHLMMPGDVKQQYQLFNVLYPGISNTTFFSESEKATAFACKDKMDLVFILDSSGSVSDTDFALMLNFTADIVDVMNVTSEAVRVADVVYSTNVVVEFDFDDYTSPADLRTRLLNTQKLDTTTNTDLGLDMATTILYAASRGARQGVKKVAVLVTDGRSNDFSRTLTAAQNLKVCNCCITVC